MILTYSFLCRPQSVYVLLATDSLYIKTESVFSCAQFLRKSPALQNIVNRYCNIRNDFILDFRAQAVDLASFLIQF